MNRISKNTRLIEHSKIRKMFNQALKYENPISFTLGEPDFSASDSIVEATCRALNEGKSKYSENAGILPLRQAICHYLENELDVHYNAENEITVTTGAMGGLYLALKVILDPGDEVIVNEPCWTNYIQQIKMCEGVPVHIRTDSQNGFTPDPVAIEKAITPKTKAIIINSPCNPTGAVFSRNTLQEIAQIAIKNNIIIISDEVYKHLIYDNTVFTSISQLDNMKENTLIVDSFSKTFAMTGFRIGYVAGPADIMENITKLQENVVACAAMPSQYAALEALNNGWEYLYYMVDIYKERRDYLEKRILSMPLITYEKSAGTFYAFVSIKNTGMKSEEFAMKLLERKQVVVVPGNAFGDYGEGYIRISFSASMEKLEQGMNLLQEFLEEIKENGC